MNAQNISGMCAVIKQVECAMYLTYQRKKDNNLTKIVMVRLKLGLEELHLIFGFRFHRTA